MPGGYHRFRHSALIASLTVEQLEVTGRATSKLRDVRLGRPAAQDVALGGGDWAKQIRWGSPVRHFKWACRDEAACQERQAQRKEMAGG
jgi:hypothetical protein